MHETVHLDIRRGADFSHDAFSSAGAGQSSETKTKIKTDDAQTVTYAGCIGSTETRSYVLQNVQPVSTTRTTTAAQATPGRNCDTCGMFAHVSLQGRNGSHRRPRFNVSLRLTL